MTDRKIAEALKRLHTGECRAISSRELAAAFGISGRALRDIVNRLREAGIPICSSDYGYFYAENEQELNRTIRQLSSRIQKIAIARRGLIKARTLFADDGQTRLPLEGGDVF